MRSILRSAWVFVAVASGCASYPATTRMKPVAAYGARHTVTYSRAPMYTAGPTERRTYSPDGSTLFVCRDGSTVPGWKVEPGSRPAC